MPHTLQDVEESGEDFADEIDDVQADEDEPSEPEIKKRKVCAVHMVVNHLLIGVQRTAPKTAAVKPASKKAKPASGRAKKVKSTDEAEED
jgi:hypothetical protein